MLTDYIKAAMREARYEILTDNWDYYGEIPACRGVCATAMTLEGCRDELAAVLEEWVFVRIHRNLDLPVIGGVELAVRRAAEDGVETTEFDDSDFPNSVSSREALEQLVQDGLDSPRMELTPELSQEIWDTAIARSRARTQNAR